MQGPTDDMSTAPEEAPAHEPGPTTGPAAEPEVGSTLAAGTRVLSRDDPTAHAPSRPHGLAGIRDAFSRHRAAFVLLGVGAVAIAFILVVAGIHASNLPPADVIETDATSRLATPPY